MLETILYFALGFLCAALIALMISPAIWNRAVTLTRKRVESSVPLTLNEIQADKDQLRAEFAMSTRRLEMSVNDLREKAASQVIEIGRKRDELAKLAEESRDKIKTIEELEARSSEQRARLRDREEKLMDANRRLDETRETLEQKASELEGLRMQLSSAKAQADSNRIELVAKQTQMDHLSDVVSDLEKRGSTEEAEELRKELKRITSALQREKNKRTELAEERDRLRKEIEDRDNALERAQGDVARLRETTDVDDRTNAELTSQLMDEKSKVFELQSKLATSTLQMEALLNDASNDNVTKAMESMNRDREQLQEQLAAVTAERDALKESLSGQSRAQSRDWEEERRENAILRERINDMAAQVTAMTSILEGDKSAIDKILSAAPQIQRTPADNGKVREAANGVQEGRPPTLADRIRALQDTARREKAG